MHLSSKEIDKRGVVVEAGDMGKSLPASREKDLTPGDADFLQCFEAIGSKGGGDND